MNTIKKQLIIRAVKHYMAIVPFASYRILNQCFTVEDGNTMFWFNLNTKDNSTHMIMQKCASGKRLRIKNIVNDQTFKY